MGVCTKNQLAWQCDPQPFFLLVPTIPLLSSSWPIFHPYPCSSLNDNILVMVAFVFLGPDAWICQDVFPAHRLRGLLLRGNLGSLLRQLNSLTLCFLIKITLWLIRQKEGALPLTCPAPLYLLLPPARFPGRFDYNLWRTFLTAKLLKMCWQMRQPGQLVKPQGCRQPGREGQSERGRRAGGEKRTDGAEIWQGDSVCKRNTRYVAREIKDHSESQERQLEHTCSTCLITIGNSTTLMWPVVMVAGNWCDTTHTFTV